MGAAAGTPGALAPHAAAIPTPAGIPPGANPAAMGGMTSPYGAHVTTGYPTPFPSAPYTSGFSTDPTAYYSLLQTGAAPQRHPLTSAYRRVRSRYLAAISQQ